MGRVTQEEGLLIGRTPILDDRISELEGRRIGLEAAKANASEIARDHGDAEAANAQFQENVDDILEAATTDRRLRSAHEARLRDDVEARFIGRSRTRSEREKTPTANARPERRVHRRVSPQSKSRNPQGHSPGERDAKNAPIRSAPRIDPRSIPVLNRVILSPALQSSGGAVVID